MSESIYEYRIRLSSGREEVLVYEIQSDPFELPVEVGEDAPEWTELGHNQCPNCPLSAQEYSHCPVALQLRDLVSRFDQTRSIERATVVAKTPQREVSKEVALQDALASVLELIFPASGCPVTAVMKPLAREHLPLASEEETIIRVTGTYLLAQYFKSQDTGSQSEPFDGLGDMYEQLHQVNTAVAGRLKHATSSDSVKNAVALIDMYSLLIPVMLEDQLAELRGIFPDQVVQGRSDSSHLASAKAYRRSGIADDSRSPEGLPEWMRSIADGEETKEDLELRERKLEELLHKADELHLEPMDDEEDSTDEAEDSGRAVYRLPDD